MLQSNKLDVVIEKYKQVFEKGLGTFNKVETIINVVAEAKPHYFKPRPV